METLLTKRNSISKSGSKDEGSDIDKVSLAEDAVCNAVKVLPI